MCTPGGSNQQIQFNNSGVLDGASGAITDGVHSAFGNGSTIDNGATTDNKGDTYSSDCVLTVAETNTDPAGSNGVYVSMEQNPSSTPANSTYSLRIDTIVTGAGSEPNSIINMGMYNQLSYTGSEHQFELDAFDSIVANYGTGQIDYLGGFSILGGNESGGDVGTYTGFYSFYDQGFGDNGGTTATVQHFVTQGGINVESGNIGDYFGFYYGAPGVSGSGLIANQYALYIEDVTVATGENYAIKTGLGKIEFGDSVKYDALLIPGTIYSSAGTPLPTASMSLIGSRAVVSDATAPTFLGAYVSGGSVVSPVFCNGTDWVTA